MNTDTIQAIAQIVLLIVGPLLAKNHVTLTRADLVGAIGGVMTAAGVVWKLAHLASLLKGSPNQATTTITAGKGNGLGPAVPLMVALLGTMFFAGCANNPPVVGHVALITTRGFGLWVETSSVPNGTPNAKLGLFSQQTFVEPVITNNAVEVPNFASTSSLQNSVNAGLLGLNAGEDLASGNYMTGNGTNGFRSQPIVPSPH